MALDIAQGGEELQSHLAFRFFLHAAPFLEGER